MQDRDQKKRLLLLLTAEYPFGRGETFLENELPFLSGAFDEVHIISRSRETLATRQVPPKTIITRVECNSEGFAANVKALWLARNPVFRDEKKAILRTGIKSRNFAYKVALKSLLNARTIDKFLQGYIWEHARHAQVFLYSYWADDAAVALALYKQKHGGVTCFTRMHRWDLYSENHPAGYLPYRLLLLKKLDALFVISGHGINYLKEKYSEDHCGKLLLSRLGTINGDKFIFKSSDKLRLFSCSSLIPRKRVKLIIETLSLVGDIPVQWDHFGSGEEETELLLQAQVMLGGKNNIEYHFHGWKSNAQVYEFYRSAGIDLFINVSSDEGVPVSIMETFSFGVPVIATNAGGNAEIVNDDHNGFLLSADPTPDVVAVALKKYFLLTAGQKELFSRNAYDTWNEKYNAEKNYPEFIRLIFSVLINKTK